jgi:mersacidin/lichenicidin family type 2 lantibiotic
MMDIIRAWKDEEYRLSLTEEQQALLPDNPAGLMELSDAELWGIVAGGGDSDSDSDSDSDGGIGVSATLSLSANVTLGGHH